MEAFLRRYRLEAAEREARRPPRLSCVRRRRRRPSAIGRALGRLEALGGEALEAFRSAAAERNVALIPSAASHAVLPLIATTAGRRLQIDAGLRSHRRRFGAAEGFWLPECAYRPGIEPLLAERGLRFFCTDQSGHERPLDALAPARAAAGLVAFTLDWEAVELVWSPGGYPSDPAYAEFHRLSMEGTRLWSIGGDPYDPAAARARAESHAGRVRRRRGRAACGHSASSAASPASSPSRSIPSCLGHWWSEGPIWLEAVLRLVAERGVRLLTLPEALERHEPEERPLRESTWGEGKDLRTWDSPEVADLAWAARRLELRLLAAIDAEALAPQAAERGARELLALQASDWAFLDRRKQAGDYPYQRSTDHARALLEAIHSREPPDPRMRNLAPDLSLVPLLEP